MKRRNQSGAVSALLLMGMSVLLILCLGASMSAVQSMNRASRDTSAVVAFQAAQAGLEYQISAAFDGLPENEGHFQYGQHNLSDVLHDFAPGCQVTSEVRPTSDPTRAWITCSITYKGLTTSVRNYVDSRNVGVWNNAIFAGAGAVGQAINGNVDIRGSVHILGEGEPYSDLNHNGQWDPAEVYTDSNSNGHWDPGEPFVDANGDHVWNAAEPYNDLNHNSQYDPPLTQTDLNSTLGGTAYIGNNYYNMPTLIRGLVSAPPTRNGVEQLGTEVRAKHGRISINGSATIGLGYDPDGGACKGMIDGSYVSDGYVGNQGAAAVHSDNGSGNSYDLGALGITFPIVGGLGAQPYRDPWGNNWDTEEEFLESKSLYVNKESIKATTTAFSIGPDAHGNSISFVPQVMQGNNVISPAVLTVNGIVRFPGDLQLGDSKETIRFQGSGTVYTRGDLSVSCSLLPTTAGSFPGTNRIGLLSMRDINLACGSGDAQLSLCGAFYAQGKVVSRKQNMIAGTFVSSYFDMGTNVPSIYQVPELATNLPPGMPGDKLYFTLKVKSWRERNIQ